MRSIFAAIAALCLLAGVAWPQTSIPATALWDAVSPYVAEALAALATALLGLIFAWLRAKLGIDIEARHREALHSAAVTGLNLGLAKVGGVLAGRDIKVGWPVLAEAILWVEKSVPDALAHLGITPESLEQLILAKAQQMFGTSWAADR